MSLYVSFSVSLYHSPSVSYCPSLSQVWNNISISISVLSPLTRAVVVDTKQMVVVLAVTEVNEDVVVQYFSWNMFGFGVGKSVL